MTDYDQMNNPYQTPHKLPQPVVIGNFKVMYRPGQMFERAKARLIQQALSIHETQHFLFAHMPDTQKITLVHQFTHDKLDNNIGQYLMHELAPHGLMTSESDFGAALIGVVNSTNPHNPADAWGVFSINTLQLLREKIHNPPTELNEQSFITPFAHIYRYLFAQKAGTSLLDVGCACAFWPLLVAEQEKGKHERIVGVDNRQDAITLSRNMASLAHIHDVEFIQSDLLSPEFTQLGHFDTVTAIHLIEHISEDQLHQALANLLAVTKRKLIIAVPYEHQAEVAYGHKQVFSHKKLEELGNWCVAQMGRKGISFCEDVMGGILVVERRTN